MHRPIARMILALVPALLLAPSTAGQGFAPGHIFVTTQNGDGVLEFDEQGAFVRLLGEAVGIGSPTRLAFGPDGLLYVGDQGADRVWVLDAAGAKVRELVHAELEAAVGIAFGPGGNVFVASASNDRVVEFEPDGSFVRSLGVGTGLDLPAALCFGPDGHLYVLGGNNDLVFEFDPRGTLLRQLGTGAGLGGAGDLLVNAEGHLLVCGEQVGAVVELDAEGGKVGEFGAAALDGIGFCMTRRSDGLLLVGDQSSDIATVDEAGVAGPRIEVSSVPGASGAVLGIACAPFRFAARLTGSLQRAGQAALPRTESATLSWYPGSGDAFLLLVDGPGADDLVSAGAPSTLALHGIALDLAGPKPRARFLGSEVSEATLAASWASLSLQASGPLLAGTIVPKKIAGRFEWAGSGAGFSAKVATGKAVP